MKVDNLKSIMGKYFQNIEDEFKEMVEFLDSLKEEVQSFVQTQNTILIKKICKIEEKNNQQIMGFYYLKSSMKLVCEEAFPLQVENRENFKDGKLS